MRLAITSAAQDGGAREPSADRTPPAIRPCREEILSRPRTATSSSSSFTGQQDIGSPPVCTTYECHCIDYQFIMDGTQIFSAMLIFGCLDPRSIAAAGARFVRTGERRLARPWRWPRTAPTPSSATRKGRRRRLHPARRRAPRRLRRSRWTGTRRRRRTASPLPTPAGSRRRCSSGTRPRPTARNGA